MIDIGITEDAVSRLYKALDEAKDAGTHVDTGGGLGSYDFWVTIGGREYYIGAKPSLRQTHIDAKTEVK